MILYFSPLACSVASRIVIYETGVPVEFRRVDTAAGRTDDGADFTQINPKGLVPALQTDEGAVLTESAAVLQHLADLRPEAGLAPEGLGRRLLQQWLSFIGSELHTGVFRPLLARTAPADAKTFARDEAIKRFEYLNRHLDGREWLLDDFSVADAYLAAVLNWAELVKFDFRGYPNVAEYLARAKARPSIARALGEEMALFAKK